MTTTTTTIPLTELLSLNYLSNYTLLYEHESPPPPPSSANTLTNNNSSEVELQQLKLKSLNATKLSLLIVKAIAARDDDNTNTTVNNNAASINNDEFNTVDTNVTTTKNKSAYHVNNFHIKLKLPSNGGITSNGNNNTNCIVLLGADIVPPSSEAAAVNGANGEAEEVVENQPSDSRDLQNIGYTLHSVYKSDNNNDNEYDNIEPIPLTVNSNGINGSISNGYHNQEQLRLVSNCDITRDEEMNGVSNGSSGRREELRMFKMRRSSQDFSLFTSLVESGECPIAICRLLSDMIEPSNTSTSSFMSIQEVIQDLEQMINTPQIYLYNQSQEDMLQLSNKKKNTGYYGRVEELTTILEISNRILPQHEGVGNEGEDNKGVGNAALAEEQQEGDSSGIESREAGNTSDEGGEESREISKSLRRMGSKAGGSVCTDVIYISGTAGAGKSKFTKFVGDYLENMGWMTLRIKFKRGLEYESKEILSSLFDTLVGNLISMKNGYAEVDKEYSVRASMAILDALDLSSLVSLSEFIPSLRQFIPAISSGRSSSPLPSSPEANLSHWRLVYLLSTLLGVIVGLDRKIMLCLDDLQWCDATTSSLISEIIISVSHGKEGRLLCVGMYRDNEIDETHPFAKQLRMFQKCSTVNVTEISLPSLSRDDVADMIMSELRLPRRLVCRLADIIHKKTSGHALFVIQFLTSLIQDAAIAYSPMKHRLDWDEDQISEIKTPDDVACLIVSNLSHLKPKALQSIRLLSCFGISSEKTLVNLIENSPLAPLGGLDIPSLVAQGVLDISDSSVSFAHDLIQQHIYENIPLEERQKLHLDIALCLGTMTELDEATEKSSIIGGRTLGDLNLSDASSLGDDGGIKPVTLIHIATNQINIAGPSFITDKAQRIRYAGWNLVAANEALESSNFPAALNGYKKGIAFISEDLWVKESTYQLCLELHEGAVFSSYTINSSSAEVEMYATAIIDNVQFEDSLVAQDLMCRYLQSKGSYSGCTTRGMACLRQLKIDIPPTADQKSIVSTMQETATILSQYTTEQIKNLKNPETAINSRKQQIIYNICHSVVICCFRESSPFLPLLSCLMVQYSLSNGLVEESAMVFSVFGYLLTALMDNFDLARRCGEISESISTKADPSAHLFARLINLGFCQLLFRPHQEIASDLVQVYLTGMKGGEIQYAVGALYVSVGYSFFGGSHLNLLSETATDSLGFVAKHNYETLGVAVTGATLVDSLTGIDTRPYLAFEGKILNEECLLADAIHSNNHSLMEAIYTGRFISAFWKGQYAEANKWYDLASELKLFSMIKIRVLHCTFYRGLVAFQLYRDGQGEDWLDEGRRILTKVEGWSRKCCTSLFENKLHLLQAEDHASDGNIARAKKSYELSIALAGDVGLIHEQGLAAEYYGKFLSSIVELDEANVWLLRAHSCYTQWGALVKADQMINDYNLVIPAVYDISMRTSFKRGSEVVAVDEGPMVGSGGQIRRHSMYY